MIVADAHSRERPGALLRMQGHMQTSAQPAGGPHPDLLLPSLPVWTPHSYLPLLTSLAETQHPLPATTG